MTSAPTLCCVLQRPRAQTQRRPLCVWQDGAARERQAEDRRRKEEDAARRKSEQEQAERARQMEREREHEQERRRREAEAEAARREAEQAQQAGKVETGDLFDLGVRPVLFSSSLARASELRSSLAKDSAQN